MRVPSKQLKRGFLVNYLISKPLFAIIFFAAVGIIAMTTISYENLELNDTNSDIPWTLPSIKHLRADTAERQKLQQLNIWNAQIVETNNNEAPEHKAWDLKGIVFESKTPYVLIFRYDINKLERYRVDQLLPNGEKLLTISANNMTFEFTGESHTRELHRKHSN